MNTTQTTETTTPRVKYFETTYIQLRSGGRGLLGFRLASDRRTEVRECDGGRYIRDERIGKIIWSDPSTGRTIATIGRE